MKLLSVTVPWPGFWQESNRKETKMRRERKEIAIRDLLVWSKLVEVKILKGGLVTYVDINGKRPARPLRGEDITRMDLLRILKHPEMREGIIRREVSK